MTFFSIAANPTKGFKVDAGGYCPEIALLKIGLSSLENKLSTSAELTIELSTFGLYEGELIRALINPVLGSKATKAPRLFLNSL